MGAAEMAATVGRNTIPAVNSITYRASLTRDLDMMTKIGDITGHDLECQQNDLNDESISDANIGCIGLI